MDFEDDNLDLEFSEGTPAKDSVRRVMNLYYLIDTSGSMSESGKMESINQVMPEVVELVSDISNSNVDTAQIDVACLTFSTGAHWMYSAPIEAKDFQWTPCTAGGLTDLGRAYDELEKHLHRSTDLGNDHGHFAPAIILMTDGMPTDDQKSALKRLQNNEWFKAAIKVAIAIGTDVDNEVLRDFVGQSAAKEAIIQVHDVETLKEMIRLVSCAVSKHGSSNTSTDKKNKSEQIVEEITGTIDNDLDNDTSLDGGVLDIKPIGDDIFD